LEEPPCANPEAIGIAETYRLELGVGLARPAEVGVLEDEKLSELDVIDVMKDETSIVFVLVTTGSNEEVGAMTDAVIVVEAIGAAGDTLGKVTPFFDCPEGITEGVGVASTNSGKLRNDKTVVSIPRMSRLRSSRNGTVAPVNTSLPSLRTTCKCRIFRVKNDK
jgi:hypothetical protein